MKNLFFLITCLMSVCAYNQEVYSPNKDLHLVYALTPKGEPTYTLYWKNKMIIEPSKLGFTISGNEDLSSGMSTLGFDTSAFNELWKPVWGEVNEIKNEYNQLRLIVVNKKSNKIFKLYFRLYNDGLAFRYEFPEQPKLKYFIIEQEKTEINFAADHEIFWIPGDYDTNEYRYSKTKMSVVNAIEVSNQHPEIATRTPIGKNFIQTPCLIKTNDNLYINIHEAALVNYAAMQIEIDQTNFDMHVQLTPDAVGNKCYLKTPDKTPWRTIIISDKATDILSSKIILNCNEPSVIKETSWIKPMKYIGVWWEMHVGTGSWNYSNESLIDIEKTNWNLLEPNKTHAANTERVKYYIDFASTHGFDGVLIEGWNIGWEDWFGNWKENVFDFVTPYPDFNLIEIKNYAQQKNVQLIMHHETSASVTNYERRMQDAFAFMKLNNYQTVKTGYVGRIIPRGEFHDGQWMVNHYIRVIELAVKNKMMIDAHEPVRPTGLHRTYPNFLACEAARGNEFNAWSSGNLPEHETILPFTRLIGGPMDYTPGIFQIKMDKYKSGSKYQVHTTLAKQLALYITMYSPLQMAADIPENYLAFLDAFQFIKDVSVDWDLSIYIEAEPGDYITIARKEKKSDRWFLGSITDEEARTASIKLDFLDPNKKYVMTIYADAADADWKNNPMAYKIETYIVTSKTATKIFIAPGGGAAMSLFPASENDIKNYKLYRN